MANEKRLIDADKLIDSLYDNEFTIMCPLDKVSAVIDDINKAMSDLVDAIGQTVAAIVAGISEIFANLDLTVPATYDGTAYLRAAVEHPEWVRKAYYNKKRRIRKKYHDRIMKKYGKEWSDT